MKKVIFEPRKNWQQRCEELGFSFHSLDDDYWCEHYAYEFTLKQIEEIEDVTQELHNMSMDVVDDIVKSGNYDFYFLTDKQIENVEKSWKEKDFHLYGRFDLSYDGINHPKMLEYNADTPTSLLEGSVIQWDWLEQVIPQYDQFNSIHEKLLARFALWNKDKSLKDILYFTGVEECEEDMGNLFYLMDVATQAGLNIKFIPIHKIGYSHDDNIFLDEEDKKIQHCFKLYPWEIMLKEEFGSYVSHSNIDFIEPAWKSLLSSKALLPILWSKYKGHPNLLPSFFNEDLIKAKTNKYVKKPIYSREGSNIEIIENGQVIQKELGPYGAEGFVYQEFVDLPIIDNRYPCIGSWVVGDEPAGIGIRDDLNKITANLSRFVPHYFKE